jgi:hypothetical protein
MAIPPEVARLLEAHWIPKQPILGLIDFETTAFDPLAIDTDRIDTATPGALQSVRNPRSGHARRHEVIWVQRRLQRVSTT